MSNKNQIVLTSQHRVMLITLLITQYLLFIFAQIIMVHFHSIDLPFINYSSLTHNITTSSTHYLSNALLYCLFWLQHILMATLKYKVAWFKTTKYFVLYDRYVYNIASGVTLWFIFSHIQTSHEVLFELPSSAGLPFAVVGLFMLIKSTIQLGGRILNPYKLRDLISSKQITYQDYSQVKDFKLKTDGIYGYTRNPMQTGVLLLLAFGNGVYTIDRVIFVVVMGLGVVVGVMMQEKRMVAQYSDYKNYAQQVKSRFVPFLF